MARLVCSACRQPPGDGKNCQNCSRSLAEPGAIIDLDAASQTTPTTPTPSRSPVHTVEPGAIPSVAGLGAVCSEPGCTNPRAVASLVCTAHRDLQAARRHQDYSLRCTRGFVVDVPDGSSVTLGTSAEHSPFAEQLADCRFVSRRHATVSSRGGALTIVDHHSRNGTIVVDTEIEPETTKVLVPGDKVVLGHEAIFYVR